MNQPIKILVLEDKLTDVEFIQKELHKSGMKFELKAVDNKLDYTNALNNYNADVILANHICKQFHSTEALELIKSKKIAIPFIVVTDSVNEEFAVMIIKLGAEDYILKTNLSRLASAIEAALRHKKQNLLHNVENYARLEEVQEIAKIGFWSWIIKTGEVEWSKEVYKIFGLNPDTFKPNITSILDLSPWPEDNARGQEIINKAIESKQIGSYEQKFLLPDNTVGYYYSSFQGKYSKNGELVSISGTVIDITENKEREAALKNSESLFRNLSTNAAVAIFQTNVDGECNFVNEAWMKYSGMTFEEAMGNSWSNALHPDDKERVFAEWQSAVDSGEEFISEYRFQKKPAETTWLSSKAVPIIDTEGRKVGYIGVATDISKRKTAEEKLQHSEALAGAIFNSKVIGFFYFDANGEIIDANEFFLKTFGYSKEDLLEGKLHWDKMTPPEYTERDQLALQELAETGICLPFEKAFICKDGSQKAILIGGGMIQEENTTKGYAYVMDITERLKAKNELHYTLQKLEEAQEISKLGYWEFDLISFERIWSKQVFENYNFTVSSELPTTEQILQHTHPEDRKIVSTAVEKAWKGIQTENFIIRTNPEFGPLKYLLNIWQIIYNDAGEPKKLLGTVQDITERKKAEEVLQDTLHKLEEAQETAGLGHWEMDLATSKRIWSKQVFKNFNFPIKTEAPDITEVSEHVHPEDRDLMLSSMKKIVQGGQPDMFIMKTNPKYGPLKYLLSSWHFILDEKGEVKKMLGTSQDISNIKKIELKLLEQNLALKKANTELDRFVYSASHDLRAPLKSMLGLTDLLQLESNPEDSDQSMLIDMIKKSVLKLDDFIEDILDYSRNARVEFHFTELNFEEIIEDIRGNHKFMDGAKDVVINLDVQLDAVFVSDIGRVKIILNNLISNAVKYQNNKNNDSFVLIKIRCDQTKATIEVTDNGIGIASNDHEEIFKMFHRATNLSTGSGLGLYIVNEALEKLGGTIKLESELGKGATFSLTIPNNI